MKSNNTQSHQRETQPNGTQQNGTLQNDIRQNDTRLVLSHNESSDIPSEDGEPTPPGTYNRDREIIDRLDRIEKKLQGDSEQSASSRPLTFDETADYLGISKSYLYKLTSQARIPHYKPEGKKVYFDKTELDQWLLRNRVTPRSELGKKAADILRKNRESKSGWKRLPGQR